MREELPPIQQNTRGGRRIAVLALEPPYKLPNVLAAVGDVRLWPFTTDVPLPTQSAVTRAKELVLAVGPLTEGGPSKVIVGPSIKGGVVVTFFLGGKKDVTVASLNNQTSVLVLGKGWTGELQVEEIAHADALARVRAICRPET